MNRRVEKLLASVFGIGFLPLAPGTWASVLAVFTWWFLHNQIEFTATLQIVALSLSLLVGLWSSIRLEKAWGKDPSQIVVDE